MGQNMVWRLAKAGHEVVVTDTDADVIRQTVAIESKVATITVDHLLSMRAGLERTSGMQNYGRWVQSPNWVSFALSRGGGCSNSLTCISQYLPWSPAQLAASCALKASGCS